MSPGESWGVRARSSRSGTRWARDLEGRVIATSEEEARKLASAWNARSGFTGPSYWAEQLCGGDK